METTKHGWRVIDRDNGILTYTYKFTKQGEAESFAARMKDGRLVVISPGTRLDDGAFTDLEEFGGVGAVVAPNGFHHLGTVSWRKRFPDVRFFASPEAQTRIKKKNAEAPDMEPISALSELVGENVHFRAPSGTKVGETYFWAKSGDANVWYTSDVFCNWQKFPGPLPLQLLWKWTKSGPGFSIFHLAMLATLKDKKGFLSTMLGDLKANPPSKIVVAHGPMLDEDGLADRTFELVSAAC